MDKPFNTQVIDGKKWLEGQRFLKAGQEAKPIRLMFVGQNPTGYESDNNKTFGSDSNSKFRAQLEDLGFDLSECFFTYAVKYSTYENRTPTATQIKECRPVLSKELEVIAPKLVIALGATAFQAIMGGGYKITSFLGVMLPLPGQEQPSKPVLPGPAPKAGLDTQVFPIWAPTYIARSPQAAPQFENYLKSALQHLSGELVITNKADIKYEVVSSMDGALDVLCRMGEEMEDFLSIDTETKTMNWMSKQGYIRTLQINWAPEKTAVFRFKPTMLKDLEASTKDNLVFMRGQEPCVDILEFMPVFRRFLEMRKPKLIGHNLRYDGEWLLAAGADIRPYSFYDTMLAEHLINNNNMLGLDDLALKYTSLGKYDGELNKWKRDNRELVSDDLGYACIPEPILFPYGAADVLAPRLALYRQLPELERCLQPRGRYPSLFDTEMETDTEDLYEIEIQGLPIDMERVDLLTEKYQSKRRELEAQFLTMVMSRGYSEEFNHRSVDQVRKLLFDPQTSEGKGGLGLVPITTTKPKGGQQKKWEWVLKQPADVRVHYRASTNKQSLEILEDKHPVVYHLLNLRRVDIMCKNFFRDDDEGGIKGNRWDDGRVHSRISQITSTGRLRSEKPNIQNWGKQAERFLLEIFGKDNVPEPMRSICVAPEGHVFIEGDYKQAELFMLAALSDDRGMMEALTTPGKDLHTNTTLDNFKISRLFSDLTEVGEQYTLDLAAKDLKAFEKLEKTFLYRTQKGEMLTHDAFKSGIRTAGKALSFGIMYGRGALAFHYQVLAETGVDVPVDEIQQAIVRWKTEKYATAWSYLESCQNMAVDPGWIENPFGRRRYFPKVEDEAVAAGNKRESGNFRIQSTVSDAVRLACRELRRLRARRKLSFTLNNQIHDALLILSPIAEKDEAKLALKEAMESVEIPLNFGGSLFLSADIETFTRWGVKEKKQ